MILTNQYGAPTVTYVLRLPKGTRSRAARHITKVVTQNFIVRIGIAGIKVR
jgi:hypothetical protein